MDIDEATEKFCYDNETGIRHADEMYERCLKINYILKNLESMLAEVEGSDEDLNKCKNELVEQGILDVVCRIVEIVYYKTTPPCLFKRPFHGERGAAQKGADGAAGRHENAVDLETIKIDEYIAQEVARENLE